MAVIDAEAFRGRCATDRALMVLLFQQNIDLFRINPVVFAEMFETALFAPTLRVMVDRATRKHVGFTGAAGFVVLARAILERGKIGHGLRSLTTFACAVSWLSFRRS